MFPFWIDSSLLPHVLVLITGSLAVLCHGFSR